MVTSFRRPLRTVNDHTLGLTLHYILGVMLMVSYYFHSISKATFFRVTSQNSVNVSLNYVLHFSKNIPVSGAIRKELHNVVYTAGKQN